MAKQAIFAMFIEISFFLSFFSSYWRKGDKCVLMRLKVNWFAIEKNLLFIRYIYIYLV